MSSFKQVDYDVCSILSIISTSWDSQPFESMGFIFSFNLESLPNYYFFKYYFSSLTYSLLGLTYTDFGIALSCSLFFLFCCEYSVSPHLTPTSLFASFWIVYIAMSLSHNSFIYISSNLCDSHNIFFHLRQ